MKEFKLKVEKKEFVSESLGISEARAQELAHLFTTVRDEVSINSTEVALSDIILKISELDITPEEYTFLILTLGAQIAE